MSIFKTDCDEGDLIAHFKETYERYGPTWKGTDDEIRRLLKKAGIGSIQAARAHGEERGRALVNLGPRPPGNPE